MPARSSFGGRVAMLRQTVQAADGETLADLLGIRPALARLRRLDAGTGSLADAAEADWTLEARLEAALAEVGLAGVAADRPLATLSGGQRTRAALAALIFAEPDLILLDEPTNNLDADGRAAIAGVLAGWKKGAVVVSHDRALLRPLDRIVELSGLGARVYGGGYDLYAARKAEERAAAERDLDVAKRDAGAVERRIQTARERKARSATRKAPAAAPGATSRRSCSTRRRSAARRRAGGASALAERQRAAAAEALAEAEAAVERVRQLAVRLPSTGLPAGRTVLAFDGVGFAYPGDDAALLRHRLHHERAGARGADRAERLRQVHLPEARQRRGRADLGHGAAAGRLGRARPERRHPRSRPRRSSTISAGSTRRRRPTRPMRRWPASCSATSTR